MCKKFYIFSDGKKDAQWDDEYEKFLRFLINNKDYLSSFWGRYEDPDSKRNCPMFYEDLCKFLNAQEKNINGLKGEFIYKFNEEKDPYGIAVILKNKENSKPFTFLKSDQLGFSAPSINLNHIYDIYLKNGGDVSKVKEWILYSRTLGGSFLWPMETNDEGKWIENPDYNVNRGGTQKGGSYIKDRVDLTLKEIKNYLVIDGENRLEEYQKKYCNSNGEKGKDYQVLYNSIKENSNMKVWLDHFSNFNNYIEFFKFNSFIENDEVKPLVEPQHKIYKMGKDEIKHMLDKLVDMIKERTIAMEELNESFTEL